MTVARLAARWLLDREPYTTQVLLGPNTFEQPGTVDWTLDGTTTRDGTPVYRFTGTRVRSTPVVSGGANLSQGVMYVDEDGFIRGASLQYTGETGSYEEGFETVEVTYELDLTALDEETVDRPAWLDDAVPTEGSG